MLAGGFFCVCDLDGEKQAVAYLAMWLLMVA